MRWKIEQARDEGDCIRMPCKSRVPRLGSRHSKRYIRPKEGCWFTLTWPDSPSGANGANVSLYRDYPPDCVTKPAREKFRRHWRKALILQWGCRVHPSTHREVLLADYQSPQSFSISAMSAMTESAFGQSGKEGSGGEETE